MCSRSRYLLPISLVALAWAGAAANAATKEVEVNGVRVSYVDEGTGEPVVFVHDALGDPRVWEPVRGAIADEFRFVAPTLRYFGTGDWPDKGERFGVATHADDLAAVVRALDAGPVHLVGWSYGASVAMAAALENPGLVRSLVLDEPPLASLIEAGGAGDAAREAEGAMFGPVTPAIEKGDAEQAARLLVEGVFQMPPGGFDGQAQETRTIQLENARTMPLLWSAAPWEVTCDMLKGFDKPTLVVHGAGSNAYFVHIAEVLDKCLPQAELAAQPKVKHDGPVRDPAGFTAMVEDFVAKH